jgi:hypothetical protein
MTHITVQIDTADGAYRGIHHVRGTVGAITDREVDAIRARIEAIAGSPATARSCFVWDDGGARICGVCEGTRKIVYGPTAYDVTAFTTVNCHRCSP